MTRMQGTIPCGLTRRRSASRHDPHAGNHRHRRAHRRHGHGRVAHVRAAAIRADRRLEPVPSRQDPSRCSCTSSHPSARKTMAISGDLPPRLTPVSSPNMSTPFATAGPADCLCSIRN